ncbi:MAG: hypothetical protein CM1200mP10_03650 [Candidatus Neomarinimicrobiota bacterium]|nr:MAG: hypothetical protein CM1200mP10_03650 [Candidatus Neomarinimicrobiota bacterium]
MTEVSRSRYSAIRKQSISKCYYGSPSTYGFKIWARKTQKISDYIHFGPSTGQFLKAITSYENLTGHHYGIQFFQNDASIADNESAITELLLIPH